MKAKVLSVVVATVVLSVIGASAAGAAPQLKADYRFDDTLTSAVAGAPSLQHINDEGTNTFATENVDGRNRRVLRFPEGNGLRLNTYQVVLPTRYTIAVRFRFDDVAGYQRILAFKPNEATYADTGVYVENEDLVFYDRAHPENDTIDADEWVTIVVTRASNDVLRGYVDGVQQFGFLDRMNRAAIRRFLRFFKDDLNQEESSGAVARIRLWDEPLTPAQVAALGQ